MIFISHTATDRPFAQAIESAIHGLVPKLKAKLEVSYSTSSEAGPQGGEKWREWIDSQIRKASSVIVVVSPEALGKPWLLWEAGACHGAGLMSVAVAATVKATAPPRLFVSVAFGLTAAECPDPLQGGQIVGATNREQMKRLLRSVLDKEVPDLPQKKKPGDDRYRSVLSDYLKTVRRQRLRMPSLVNEANVQDWLSRLAQLIGDKRFSEVVGFERLMTTAFGRDVKFADPVIDVRLHRRLGEQYIERGEWERASNQLRLARRAAPRDIYVLRPLGQAYLEQYFNRDSRAGEAEREKLKSRTREVLAAIEKLDREALVKTPDAAALRVKFERIAMRNKKRAIEICERALRNNPDSYYLADILGQTWLELDNLGKAREAYEQAIDILDRIQDINVWTCASAATANLVLGRPDRTRESLEKLKRLSTRPSSAELDSVARGIRDVARRLNLTEPDIEDLMQLLHA